MLGALDGVGAKAVVAPGMRDDLLEKIRWNRMVEIAEKLEAYWDALRLRFEGDPLIFHYLDSRYYNDQ